MGKLDFRTTLGYIVAQLIGALLGSLPLFLWGEMGTSVAFGATLPGSGYSISTVVLGEVITTFTMVFLLAFFLAIRSIRRFTPAPLSLSVFIHVMGRITDLRHQHEPRRSLGPSVISGHWEGWWIYWVGPLAGMLLAVLTCSYLAKRIEVAKLYYFDSDHDRLFRRMAMPRPTVAN